MAARPRTHSTKALRLTCWNANGVRGRKMKLVHFLGQNGVDICFMTETHPRTAILVRRVTHHYAIPVPGLTQLEATATYTVLVTEPVKILAVYLLPSRSLIGSDLSACLSEGLPVLMTGGIECQERGLELQANYDMEQEPA